MYYMILFFALGVWVVKMGFGVCGNETGLGARKMLVRWERGL